MSAAVALNSATAQLDVQGALGVHNIASLRPIGRELLQNLPDPVINLGRLTHYDSTALALLSAWAKDTKQQNKSIRFIHLPPGLFSVAKLCNLDQVLDLAVDATR